jgi:hypothetical protein
MRVFIVIVCGFYPKLFSSLEEKGHGSRLAFLGAACIGILTLRDAGHDLTYQQFTANFLERFVFD